MHKEHEAELLLAVAEGLLSRDEVNAVREEAHRQGKSPLEVLVQCGRISDETLAFLKVPGSTETGPSGAVDAATLGKADAVERRAPDAPAFPVPGWDRYQCIKFLGQGGMGRVFLAYDAQLQRNVALKFVRDDDPELARRFVAEARAQARVSHERVCRVYEVGEVAGKPYIAMQYVDGQPLNALAPELTLEQKVMVVRDAAEGVHAAHRVGLIHRDIKPSNILVERAEDSSLKPYVMDFGLARDWREGHETSAALGTPHYMAPEQARGALGALDRRADVYGLGATLYHALLGQPPIPGDNALEVLSNVATVEPRPPRELNRDIPSDLEAIVLKSLEKERSARYDSARALAEDLDRFLAGEPVLARPTGLLYRLRKQAWKHRLVVSVAASGLVLVMLALGWASLRARWVQRLTERVEHIESRVRYSSLSPLHDARADREVVQLLMRELEEEIQSAWVPLVGPGHYALGLGHLSLGEPEVARTWLESAWQHGFREPRAAYALALAMGQLYQAQRIEAERVRDPQLREARLRDIERRYRDPALAFLRQSEGAPVPSTDYVKALLAFYEGRFQDALAHLDVIGAGLPWFYEAPKLRGDVYLARASQYWNSGKRDAALADFEAGRQAYAAATDIGRSSPALHVAKGQLEGTAILMELYGQGDVMSCYTRGIEAVDRALRADRDHYAAWVLKAGFHRRVAEYQINNGVDAKESIAKAVDAAREALERRPQGPEALRQLALSHWQAARQLQNRNQDPREELAQAMAALKRVGPEHRDYDYHVNIGLIFKVWADYEDQIGRDSLDHRSLAIESYLRALRLNERLPDARLNLGVAYLKRADHPRWTDPDGDLKRARDEYDQARALNPSYVSIYAFGGQVLDAFARRAQDKGGDPQPLWTAALDLYRQGIGINPKLPLLYNGIIAVLLAKAKAVAEQGGDPEPLLQEAQLAAAEAIVAAPQQVFTYNNLGEVHAERAKHQHDRGVDPLPSLRAALAAYQQVVEKVPGLAPAWANIAKAYCLWAAFDLEHDQNPQPHLAQAAAAVRAALEQNPNSASAWLYQGELRGLQARWNARRGHGQSKVFERARDAFELALELAPTRFEYRIVYGQFLVQWAVWLKGAGEPSAPLKRALDLADDLLLARPNWLEARKLRASVLAARDSP